MCICDWMHCSHLCLSVLSWRDDGMLTGLGRMTHIWVSKLTSIGSSNGLSLGWRQAIINAGILLLGSRGTNFTRKSYIFSQENAFKNVVWRMAAAILSRPQYVKHKNTRDLWSYFRFFSFVYCHLTTVNSSPLGKVAAIFADDIFNCISLSENDRILIQVSLKYVPGVKLTISQHCFR